VRFQKKMRLVSLQIPEAGATRYQNLMRQNPKLTRSRAARSTLRPKCLQSQQKKSKQGSAFVEVTHSRRHRGREARSLNLPKSPFSGNYGTPLVHKPTFGPSGETPTGNQ
jgi:hypothetical protein